MSASDFINGVPPPPTGPDLLGVDPSPRLLQGPPAPPAVPNTQPTDRERWIRAALLGVSGMLGPARGGPAIPLALQRIDAERQQQAQQQFIVDQQRYQIERQEYNAEQQAYQRRMQEQQRALQDLVARWQEQAPTLTNKTEYDRQEAAFTALARNFIGLRVPDHYFRQVGPYFPPTAEQDASRFMDQIVSMYGDDPSALFGQPGQQPPLFAVKFTNGDDRRMSFADIAELAGRPIMENPVTGERMIPETKQDAAPNDKFGYFVRSLTDRFVGEHQRQPDATERVTIAEQANKAAADTGTNDIKMQMDQLRLGQLLLQVQQAQAGRNISSNDVMTLSEMDNAIADANVLAAEVTQEGATGAIPWLTAHVPDWVTEYWGIGEAAKQRQATIDRIKQIIGKGLEGGVLRKEDEYKYVKILPILKDAPEVALYKVNGLKRALALKRDIVLANFRRAGFNVAAFEAMPDRFGEDTVQAFIDAYDSDAVTASGGVNTVTVGGVPFKYEVR